MIVARNIIIHRQFWFAIGGSASRNTVVLRAACLRAGEGVKNAARLAALLVQAQGVAFTCCKQIWLLLVLRVPRKTFVMPSA